MCGVAGYIAPFASPAWKKKTLTSLLKQSQVRGRDATGIAFITKESGLTVVKSPIIADSFVTSEEFLKESAKLPSIVIGHTRASTGGEQASSKNNDNNHPFYGMDSGIAMVHNGVVDDTKWRKTVGKDQGITHPFVSGTDSEVFLRMVETLMDEEPDMMTAIHDAAYNISGSYTLLFIRKDEPNKLWFAIHNNPLVLAYNPKENYIVFASTNKIIEEAMGEPKFYLDFFWEEQLPKLIINEALENNIGCVEVIPEKPFFNITTKEFTPATSNYIGRGGHRHTGYMGAD